MKSNWESERATPRHDLVSLAWFRRVDDAAPDGQEGIARSFDVSAKGAGLVTATEVPVSARLLLQLVTPFGKVTALARVMNVRPASNGAFRIGLLIYCVPPTDLGTWKRLVDA